LPTPELPTARLLLRGWTARDRDEFAELNTDLEVMEHFPARLTREESDAFVDRIEAGFDEHGFGLWAVHLVESGAFLGFTGLAVPRFRVDWMRDREQPIVEVGWRLKRAAWGHGYATEAASAAMSFGFERVGLPEIVSFTTLDNLRSQAVMERLGMTRLATYDHPIPHADPLRSVVYLLAKPGG
jgi:RimJ/RimL family protein N-acetyltransferase